MGQHVVIVNHSAVHSAFWLWSLPFPTKEPGLQLVSVRVLISSCRLPRLCLPLAVSPALLEGAIIPPAADGSGSSSAWPLSAFLGKLDLLRRGQLYISSGLAPGLEVWNAVFMLVLSCRKASRFTSQEPSEGFSRGEIFYKTQQGRKTTLDMLQLLSWIYTRCFLLSRQQECLG